MKPIKINIHIKKPTTPYGMFSTYLQITVFNKMIVNKWINSYTPDYFKGNYI